MRARAMARAMIAGCVLILPCMHAGPALAASCTFGVIADLPVTMDGLRATVPVRINGHQTSFWLDSGAFFSIMSAAKAAELQLPTRQVPAADFQIMGIGGSASVRYTTIGAFGFATADLRNVDFLVGGSDAGNALIGANILGVRDTEFDLANGSVKLLVAKGCQKMSLAYWAKDKPYFVVGTTASAGAPNGFRLPVRINGVQIVAEIDSGSPSSLLSRSAAQRAGVALDKNGAVPIARLGGFGSRTVGGWSARVRDVAIGDEHVLNTRLDVIDGAITAAGDAPDMLLGADYLLAHHVLFARSQGRVFITYSGGRAFRSSADQGQSGIAPKPAMTVPAGMHVVQALAPADAGPGGAAAIARRGAAELAQGATDAAIRDYTAAIGLAPNDAGLYRDRARAERMSGQDALADGDVEKSLALDPRQAALLVQRGSGRLKRGDRAGALADAQDAAGLTPPAALETGDVAGLFARLGRFERAIALIDGVLAAHPSDVAEGDLLNARCWYRGLAGTQLAAALADCNRALRRDGSRAAYLDSRGLVRFRQRDYAAAIADYDAVLKLDPKAAESLYMRGVVKLAMGDGAAGRADQAAATALDAGIAGDLAAQGLPVQ